MIRFLRSIIAIFLFILFGLGALFIRYLIFPFQKSKKENYATLQKSWQIFVWLIKITKIIDLKVYNPEKIKNIKNSIIASTHPSFIDIVILMSIIPYSTCFVANKLTRNPFLKGMVELLFISEANSEIGWLADSVEKLNEGLNIIIFPMGGRHKRDEFPKIRRGVSLIAYESKKDIVLLDIKEDKPFLQAHQPFYDAGDETVNFEINYLDKINTSEILEKFPDSVTFKTEVTKIITKILYRYKN